MLAYLGVLALAWLAILAIDRLVAVAARWIDRGR
jgi:hypothetical protein